MYNYKDFGDNHDTHLLDLLHADLADFMSNRMVYNKDTKCYHTCDMLIRTYVVVMSEDAYDNKCWPREFEELLLKSRWKKEVFGPFEYTNSYHDHSIYYVTPYCRLILTHIDRFMNPDDDLMHPLINAIDDKRVLFIKNAWDRSMNQELDGLYRFDQDFGDYFLPENECYWGIKGNSTFFSTLAPGVLTLFFDENNQDVRVASNSPATRIKRADCVDGYTRSIRLNGRGVTKNPSSFLELFYDVGDFRMTQHMLMWYAPIVQAMGEGTTFNRLNNFLMNMQRGDYWKPEYFVGYMFPFGGYNNARNSLKNNYLPNFKKFWEAAEEHKEVARAKYTNYLLRIGASW